MAYGIEEIHRRTPRDAGARNRENLLAMVSDPDSKVVSLPSSLAKRPRSRGLTFKTEDLMPAPQRTRTMECMRLVANN